MIWPKSKYHHTSLLKIHSRLNQTVILEYLCCSLKWEVMFRLNGESTQFNCSWDTFKVVNKTAASIAYFLGCCGVEMATCSIILPQTIDSLKNHLSTRIALYRGLLLLSFPSLAFHSLPRGHIYPHWRWFEPLTVVGVCRVIDTLGTVYDMFLACW